VGVDLGGAEGRFVDGFLLSADAVRGLVPFPSARQSRHTAEDRISFTMVT